VPFGNPSVCTYPPPEPRAHQPAFSVRAVARPNFLCRDGHSRHEFTKAQMGRYDTEPT